MLHRKDKRRLPIAFIPNGSGNDTCLQFSANDVGKALDFIVKGNIIKYDIGKTLLDYETEEEIPPESLISNLRYTVLNSVFGVSAKIVHKAISYKGCCCNAYKMAAIIEFCKLKPDNYNIYIDDVLVQENQPVVFMGVFNSKYGGGGMNLSPYSVVNDGMFELMLLTSKATFGGMVNVLDEAMKHCGVHGYRDDFKFYRG